MRITKIESRIIGYDVAEAWLPEGPPEGIASTWYSYSLDAFHTDEGVVGYTMQNSNIEDGARWPTSCTRSTRRSCSARTRSQIEYLWQKLRRYNRHAYNLSDGVAGSIDVALWDIAGKVANQPIAVLLGLAREKIPAYKTARPSDPTPETSSTRPARGRRQGFHGFKIQFWDGLDLDIPRFRAAREAVGADFPLMQDAAGHVLVHPGARRRVASWDGSATTGSRSRSRTATRCSSSASRTTSSADPRRRDPARARARRADA